MKRKLFYDRVKETDEKEKAVVKDLPDDGDELPSVPDDDCEWLSPSTSSDVRTPQTRPITRQQIGIPESSDEQTKAQNSSDFPTVHIRNGRKSLNERIIRCAVQCLAQYKVSQNDLAGIMVATANTIFGQCWKIGPSWENDDDEDECESDSDDDTVNDNDGSERKKRRLCSDYRNIFPSRRCLAQYIEDASYLNLRSVAEYLTTKDESTVVTIGVDDTVKSAGHRSFDVKADHITIMGPEMKRKTMTTGYLENVSHSGEDAASGYMYKLQTLAFLANTTVEDIKSSVDFWISDRAGDCGKMLECLDIEQDKILKCSAHLILGVDHGMDKIFMQIERDVGIQKLIPITAGAKVFASPGSSVHTLGLIAISKLLSPSHSSHSISLYNQYTQWLVSEGLQSTSFKGFTANRFGRIAYLAKTFLEHRDHIVRYFDQAVDTNSNRLLLAVSTYIDNDWFRLCAE
jgi:hypothetical protein